VAVRDVAVSVAKSGNDQLVRILPALDAHPPSVTQERFAPVRRLLEPVRRRRPHPSVTTIVPQLLIYASGMEFTEVIKRRKMVRAFTGEPLEPGHERRPE
jgi:hypothetical protein